MRLPRLRPARRAGGDVTAPSPPRCARCGHSEDSHNPFSKGPCYVRKVVGDRRSTYGKHYLSYKEIVCDCPAYVAPEAKP